MWLGRGSDVEAIMVGRAIEQQDVTKQGRIHEPKSRAGGQEQRKS